MDHQQKVCKIGFCITLPFFFPFRHLNRNGIQSISLGSSSISHDSSANFFPSSWLVNPFHSWSDLKSESGSSSCSLLARSFMSRGSWSSCSSSSGTSARLALGWCWSAFLPADSMADGIRISDGAGWFFSPEIFLFFLGGWPFGAILWNFLQWNGAVESHKFVGSDPI